MSETVFNFHDVVLWMTTLQCVFFGVLLLATNTHRHISINLLAFFLFSQAMISMNEMILWGSLFKLVIRENLPEIYFIGEAAYYFDGALLYLCIRSLVFRDFKFGRRDLLHLIPVLSFIVFMVVCFYSLPQAERQQLIDSESFVYSGGYITFELFAKCIRVAYCIACFFVILQYKKQLKTTHSQVNKVDLRWVTMLVCAFLFVMIIEMLLSLVKVSEFFTHSLNITANYDYFIFELIGLTSYYTTFILINLLAFTGIRYFANFEPVRQQAAVRPASSDDSLLSSGTVERMENAILENKYFKQSDITLDNLANKLGMPAKDVSLMINRHLGMNFYEYINRYRIGEAKKLLASDDASKWNITEIYLEAGFNSKSVFNTFFKKLEGVTPSQYRQQFKKGE